MDSVFAHSPGMRKSLRSYLLDEWNILMRLFRMALSRMALSRMALSRMALSRMALSRMALSRMALFRMALFQTTLGLIMLAQPALAGGSATIDRTEVTIGGFAEFADATGIITKAEKAGGMVFEAGWVVKRGWTWRTPYGVPGSLDEPAVHITYDEAAAYCQWRGGVFRPVMNGSNTPTRKCVTIRLPFCHGQDLPLSNRGQP